MEIFAKSQAGTQPIGVYGAITILAGALLLALSMGGAFLLIPLIYAAMVCLLFSREAFRDLRQIVVLVPVVIVVSTLLWQADYIDPSPMAMATSSPLVAGFIVGVEMSVRAVVTVLAVSVFVRTVKSSDLTYLIESVSGSKSFSFVLGLALNIRPYLERISRDTLNAIKMRGGFRVSNLAISVRHLMSSTTLKALAKSEDMAYAAEARAFGARREMPNSLQRDYPTASWLDLGILAGTTGVVILSFVLRLALV